MKRSLFVGVFFLSNISTVHATSTDFGTVKDISNKDSVWNKEEGSYKVNIVGNESANVTITYGELHINTLDRLENRPAGYAWLGFHISKPSKASSKTTKVKINNKEVEDYSDGDYYFGINQDKLINAVKNGQNIVYTFQFDWENDGDYEQTVTAIVEPSKVTLTENSRDGEKLWTPEMVSQYAPVPNTGVQFSNF